MKKKLLDDIEIINFRAFRDIHIKKLGRVNLVVGKNSVGKTCLLEALQIYARRNFEVFWEILSGRNEGLYPGGIKDVNTAQERLDNLQYLFHGRKNIYEINKKASIGELGTPPKRVSFYLHLPQSGDYSSTYQPYLLDPDPIDVNDLRKKFVLEIGSFPIKTDSFETPIPPDTGVPSINSVFVSVNGLGSNELETLWGKVVLTNEEKYVLDALMIVNEKITNVNFIKKNDLEGIRVPYVSIRDADRPMPLDSLGDGLGQLFGLILALVNAKNGFLLIDEIGSGLHYSVQYEMWRLIFLVATRLNVQVFATTHSNDCIDAFQVAATETEEDGILIRLEKREDKIVPIIFDEERLGIATREDIEVR